MPKTYIKDKKEFMKIKSHLDGNIFWREIGSDKVEIKVIDKSVKQLVKSLKD